MSKVIRFEDITGARTEVNAENTTPNTVLDAAKDKLNTVLVIGVDKETQNFYIASSSQDVSELNLLLDIAKKTLLEILYVE